MKANATICLKEVASLLILITYFASYSALKSLDAWVSKGFIEPETVAQEGT